MKAPGIIMIVAKNGRQAHQLRAQNKYNDDVKIAVADQIQTLSGVAPWMVIVMPGVDMEADVQGEGKLRAILNHRQRTWGDDAILLEMPT